MNPATQREAKSLFNSIKKGAARIKKAEAIICPPFVYLATLRQGLGVKLGGQNCFWEEKGAFTGETSPQMLKNLGCSYVILGHSERRRYQREGDRDINKKLIAALKAGLKVILCVGENEAENKKGKTFTVIKKQLSDGLKFTPLNPPSSGGGAAKQLFNRVEISNLLVAYEPIWAIGTGKSCQVKDAKKVNVFIKKILGKKTPVLYGGSVNSENARGYIKKAGFNGLLVGGASLKPKEFLEIIKQSI